jgi:hypothetical protein
MLVKRDDILAARRPGVDQPFGPPGGVFYAVCRHYQPRVIERLPDWHGRYLHSPSMTFAHYDFVRGSTIHEHFHPQELSHG